MKYKKVIPYESNLTYPDGSKCKSISEELIIYPIRMFFGLLLFPIWGFLNFLAYLAARKKAYWRKIE